MIRTRTTIINALAKATNAVGDADYRRAVAILRALWARLLTEYPGEELRMMVFAQGAARFIERGQSGEERDGWAVRVHAALSKRMLDALRGTS